MEDLQPAIPGAEIENPIPSTYVPTGPHSSNTITSGRKQDDEEKKEQHEQSGGGKGLSVVPLASEDSHDVHELVASKIVDPDEAICPICLEKIMDAAQTKCNHAFCKPCLAELYDRQGNSASCPLCRTELVDQKALNEEQQHGERKKRLSAIIFYIALVYFPVTLILGVLVIATQNFEEEEESVFQDAMLKAMMIQTWLHSTLYLVASLLTVPLAIGIFQRRHELDLWNASMMFREVSSEACCAPMVALNALVSILASAGLAIIDFAAVIKHGHLVPDLADEKPLVLAFFVFAFTPLLLILAVLMVAVSIVIVYGLIGIGKKIFFVDW